jgi:hypothetical protein
LFTPSIIGYIRVPSLTTIELGRIFKTTIFFLISYFLERLDFKRGAGRGAMSLVLSIVVGPSPLEALVKRVELILTYTTIAFIDKGEYCLVFVKGLT